MIAQTNTVMRFWLQIVNARGRKGTFLRHFIPLRKGGAGKGGAFQGSGASPGNIRAPRWGEERNVAPLVFVWLKPGVG